MFPLFGNTVSTGRNMFPLAGNVFSVFGENCFYREKYVFTAVKNRFQGQKCVSTSWKYLPRLKSFNRQKYVLALVGYMFPLLEKIVLTHKNMCFCQWQIYFEYWKNRFSRPEYVFLVVKIFFHELKIVFTGKSTCLYYLNMCSLLGQVVSKANICLSTSGKNVSITGKISFYGQNYGFSFQRLKYMTILLLSCHTRISE